MIHEITMITMIIFLAWGISLKGLILFATELLFCLNYD
jgi:hypothetical protein